MKEFNKFRAITAGIILMFIFAVAAMYSNTKEAAIKKIKNNSDVNLEENIPFENKEITNETQNNSENDVNEKIQLIIDRVDTLEKNVFSPKETNINSEELKCVIRGIVNDGNIVPLPPNESVIEAKLNSKEIIITCNFK